MHSVTFPNRHDVGDWDSFILTISPIMGSLCTAERPWGWLVIYRDFNELRYRSYQYFQNCWIIRLPRVHWLRKPFLLLPNGISEWSFVNAFSSSIGRRKLLGVSTSFEPSSSFMWHKQWRSLDSGHSGLTRVGPQHWLSEYALSFKILACVTKIHVLLSTELSVVCAESM